MSAAAAVAEVVPMAAMVVLGDHVKGCRQCLAAHRASEGGLPRVRAFCLEGQKLWDEGILAMDARIRQAARKGGRR